MLPGIYGLLPGRLSTEFRWSTAYCFFKYPVKILVGAKTRFKSDLGDPLIGIQQQFRTFFNTDMVKVIGEVIARGLFKQLAQIIRRKVYLGSHFL